MNMRTQETHLVTPGHSFILIQPWVLHRTQYLQYRLIGGEIRWQPNAKSVELAVRLEGQLKGAVVVVGAADGREAGGQVSYVSCLGAIRFGLAAALSPEKGHV
jgi:hypothetical protein